jgi:hypothetical protein
MSQINTELGRSSTANISLDTAENGGYATINTASSSRPSATNPATMSEWYNYNHNASSGFANSYITENNTANTSYLLSAASSGWIRTLTQATSFSVAFWFYPKTTAGVGYAFHIRDFNSTSFFYNNIAVRWTGSGLTFFMSSQPSTAKTLVISPNIFANMWSHYVITYNASNGLVTAYRNGISIATSTFSGLNMLTSINRNIAVTGLAGSAANSNATSAKVDELAFYNRVLSQAEVTSIYAARQAFNHASLSGLYDWWRFENNGNSYTGALNLTNYNGQLFPSITMPF